MLRESDAASLDELATANLVRIQNKVMKTSESLLRRNKKVLRVSLAVMTLYLLAPTACSLGLENLPFGDQMCNLVAPSATATIETVTKLATSALITMGVLAPPEPASSSWFSWFNS